MTYYTIRNAAGAALGRPSLSAPLAYGPDYCASAYEQRTQAERVARAYGGTVQVHQTPPIPDRPTCRYCGRAIGLSSFGCDC